MATVLARRDDLLDNLFDFRSDIDGLFNRLVRNGSRMQDRPAGMLVSMPPIEARIDTKEKKYHLRVALPGVSPEEVQLNLQGNVLTISGEHTTTDEKQDSTYLQREFSFERFERAIPLPEEVDADKITAQYQNGVLEIVAALTEASMAKRIEIQTPSKTKGASA
jgi:HSP20 family protein